MRRTIILAAALAIILLGLWGTVVIYFDQARLRSIMSDRLSSELGRRVEIAGAVDVSFFPRPALTLGDVLVASTDGDDDPIDLTAREISMTLRLLPLLRGELAPGRMSLDGAVIDLSRAETGGRAGASLAGAARLLSGRSLQLRDVTVRLPGQERPQEIVVDAIDLDRFSLDETVALRFRGDLGRPAVLSDASLSASLFVPSGAGAPVRLRDAELSGRLTPFSQTLDFTGDLSLGMDPTPRLTLSGGRVQIGDSRMDLSFDYRSGESAALDLLASVDRLPRAFRGLLLGMAAGAETLAPELSAWSQRVDVRAQLQLDRLRLPVLDLADVRIDLRSRTAGLGVDLLAAFPGGLVEASGVLTDEASQHMALDLSLAEAARLFRTADGRVLLGGSGKGRGRILWPGVEGSPFSIEGELQLWDGFWAVAADNEAEPAQRAFAEFSAQLRYTPGYLAIPQFTVAGAELSGEGWAGAELPDGALAGEFLPVGGGGPALSIGGRLDAARLSAPAASESDSVTGETGAEEPEPIEP